MLEGLLAAEAAAESVVVSGGWLSVVPWLFGLLAMGGTAALGALTRKLLGQGHATMVMTAIGKVTEFAALVVADLEATLKPELALATADGTLTTAEVAKLRDVALARVKALLGSAGLAQLRRVLPSDAAVDVAITGAVEREVVKLSALKHQAVPTVINNVVPTSTVPAGPPMPL
jgi:hypothetical protein